MSDEDKLGLSKIQMSKIVFRVGDEKREQTFEFEPKNISIIVGPNNSGKTLALRELDEYLNGNDEPGLIFSSASIEYPHEPPFLEKLMRNFEKPHPEGVIRDDSFYFSKPQIGPSIPRRSNNGWFQPGNLLNWLTRINETTGSIMRSQIFRHYTLRLDCESRFQLTKPANRGDPNRPSNHLASLLIDNNRREQVRKIFNDSFPGLHFALNSAIGDLINISISTEEPKEIHERSNIDDALIYHAKSLPINDAGDGIKSFVGLIIALMVLDSKFVIIDDPEAFLHPPIARNLGFVLSEIAHSRNMQVFVTTHSWEFISGCIEATKDISIIRLTYDQLKNKATARQIDPQTFDSILRHPLIRSSQPLTALFHRTTIVTEGASDRVVYREIARRLDEAHEGRVFPDNVFLTTHSAPRIPQVLGPLRKVGVSVAAILDIDQLLQKDGIWLGFKTACDLTQEIEESQEVCRIGISKIIGRSKRKRNQFKQRGLTYIEEQDTVLSKKVESLIKNLSKQGIFVVQKGCLESWFPEIGPKREGWLEDWFNAFGDTKDSPNYRKPSSDGVWAFMRMISKWLQDST
jgi:ABC-type polar amino acid transport system ATPase subunit